MLTFFLYFFSVALSHLKNKSDYLNIFLKLQMISDQLNVNIRPVRKTGWLILCVKMSAQIILNSTFLLCAGRSIGELMFTYFIMYVISLTIYLCAMLHTIRLLLKEINSCVKKMKNMKNLVSYLKFHMDLLEVAKKINGLNYYIVFRLLSVFASMVYTPFNAVVEAISGKIDMVRISETLVWTLSDVFGIVCTIYNYEGIKNEVRDV